MIKILLALLMCGIVVFAEKHMVVYQANGDSVLFNVSDVDSIKFKSMLPADGLAAYWDFDGDATDKSGNGHNGIVEGAILATDRFGRENHAYYFDGNSLINTDKHFLEQEFTFSTWVKLSEPQPGKFGHGLFFSNGVVYGGSYGNGCSGGLSKDNKNVLFEKNPFPQGGALTAPTSADLDDNKYHHIVFVLQYVYESTFLSVYQDNVFIGKATIASRVDNSTRNLTLGYGYEDNAKTVTYPYKGILDDVRIYERALSVDEISALYHENGWGN